MCAIAGVYCLGDFCIDEMLKLMECRGPDAHYKITDNNFYAGMNRLCINDAQHGSQPFKNSDSSIIVFFNGEIYNHHNLRQKLDNTIVFHGHCDGEVLPFLYEQYGTECFAYLDGMFGIAIYDKNKNKIILSRDMMGEKPLYFLHHAKTFAFCTLLKPLSTLISTTLNPRAIWDFFTFGFIPETQSIFNEIQALPKGCFLEFDIAHNKYIIKDFSKRTLEYFKPIVKDYIQSTQEIVSCSIEDRLLSDEPVGAFLSGGLDSSIVAALAAQKMPYLHTFNISFVDNDDPYCGFADESPFACMLAKHIGSLHHELKITAFDFLEYLPLFIKSIDQPFGAISGIGVKMIAQRARELGIKVLLSGDGADELFGGYEWYPRLCFNDATAITEQKPKGWHYYGFEEEKRALLSRDFFDGCTSLGYFPDGDSTPLTFIEFDRVFYLPYEMMSKLDRMCMSESVEGRACFVSPRIVSFVQDLGYETLLQHGQKWLLKEAFKKIVPMKILERKKHGFNAPVDYWLRNDWLYLLQDALSPSSALSTKGLLNAGAEKFMMQLLASTYKRTGNIAFFLVVLNLWLEMEYE